MANLYRLLLIHPQCFHQILLYCLNYLKWMINNIQQHAHLPWERVQVLLSSPNPKFCWRWDTLIYIEMPPYQRYAKKGIQSILAGSVSFMWGSYSPSSCDVLQPLTSLMRVLATTHLLSTSMTTASALESLIEATNKINAETLHEGDAVTGILVWGRPLPQCNPRRDTLGTGTPVPRIKGGEIFEDSWCASHCSSEDHLLWWRANRENFPIEYQTPRMKICCRGRHKITCESNKSHFDGTLLSLYLRGGC